MDEAAAELGSERATATRTEELVAKTQRQCDARGLATGFVVSQSSRLAQDLASKDIELAEHQRSSNERDSGAQKTIDKSARELKEMAEK